MRARRERRGVSAARCAALLRLRRRGHLLRRHRDGGALCKGEEVVVVGAGNSAGQAIVYLARRRPARARARARLRPREEHVALSRRSAMERLRTSRSTSARASRGSTATGISAASGLAVANGRRAVDRHELALPLHRRRREHDVAARLRGARHERIRDHRQRRSRRQPRRPSGGSRSAARRFSSRRAFRASSPPATFAAARSSAAPRRWARASMSVSFVHEHIGRLA